MQEYFIKAKYKNYDDVIYCAFVVSMHDYSEEGSDFFIKTDLKTLYSLYTPSAKAGFNGGRPDSHIYKKNIDNYTKHITTKLQLDGLPFLTAQRLSNISRKFIP